MKTWNEQKAENFSDETIEKVAEDEKSLSFGFDWKFLFSIV